MCTVMSYDHVSNDFDWLLFSRQATSRSLCLLDEFGKGTLTEGLFVCLWIFFLLSALHQRHVFVKN